MESIFVLSLAEVSTTCKTSGRYSHRASASAFCTSRRFSKSHLLPAKQEIHRAITEMLLQYNNIYCNSYKNDHTN